MNRFLSVVLLALTELLVLPAPTPAALLPLSIPGQGRADAGSREVFDRVQEGLAAGNVGAFSHYFSSQVMITLKGAESGYYSANQSYYLLSNYLRARQFARFAFTTTGGSDGNAYATGSVTFNFRGKRELAQLYVAVAQMDGRWMITQINIY